VITAVRLADLPLVRSIGVCTTQQGVSDRYAHDDAMPRRNDMMLCGLAVTPACAAKAAPFYLFEGVFEIRERLEPFCNVISHQSFGHLGTSLHNRFSDFAMPGIRFVDSARAVERGEE
jgi:hypothetical protein